MAATHPKNALAAFSADSRRKIGIRSRTNVRQFGPTIDEPERSGGSDAGPNPAELVLAALAASQEVTYRACADALEIPLETVSERVEGALDLRGFAPDDCVQAGLQTVRGTVRLTSSASSADLSRLKAFVDAHCPVLDMLQARVPVTLELAPVLPASATR